MSKDNRVVCNTKVRTKMFCEFYIFIFKSEQIYVNKVFKKLNAKFKKSFFIKAKQAENIK